MTKHARIRPMRLAYGSAIAAMLLSGISCQGMYYDAMEKVGVHKRDIMVSRVEKARDAQQEAQEQFQSALEQFTSLVEFDGGKLEAYYDDLNSEYEGCQTAAENVSNRISSIESVADALFNEWQAEIELYSNRNLKASSQSKLRQTQSRYDAMLKSLKRAESKMDPVLSTLRDNVLYLKHNLNAQAIGALKGEFGTIRTEINSRIAEMNRAIQSSDSFIASMDG